MAETLGNIESCSASAKSLCTMLHAQSRLLQSHRPEDARGKSFSARRPFCSVSVHLFQELPTSSTKFSIEDFFAWAPQNGDHRCRGRCTIALVFTLAMFLGSGLMWFSLGTLLTRAVSLFDELTTLHQLVKNPLLCGFNLSKSRVRSGIWRSH